MELEFEKKSVLLDLVARVAHDIRSPIAAMEVGLQLIEQRHSLSKDFMVLRMAIQRMRDITNNLLDQCRDVSTIEPVFVKALLEDVVLLKHYEWLEKNCKINLSFVGVSGSDCIVGVAIEIKRMLSNLLNNAFEACDQYGRIRIDVNKLDRFIEISISDNGIGIPAEKIKYCLLGGSTKHLGVGLGLSSAENGMKKFNGELLLKSQPGIGTTVTLRFKSYDLTNTTNVV